MLLSLIEIALPISSANVSNAAYFSVAILTFSNAMLILAMEK